MKAILRRIKAWLSGLSFKTGMIVLGVCALCYIVSFAQMLLPIGIAAKGILWTVFFGLAKASQYSGLLIIGKEGIMKLKACLRKRDPDLTA